MGIQALPQTTVRTLGATQVLNDPASVIKELVDNALDAYATSIAIEIASNTIDTIQVRDNGHGISPEDRALVARAHCTSKIAGEDDLKTIGGTSLGFRGEALASVAEMSGSLTISTRVEGEQVATATKISQQGEVIGEDRASLPVGTTVKITDFIKAHPVRRQVVLKNTEKCQKKIKQLLQSYAFARPLVRLSLRVLKAKNDSSSWTYGPKPGGNVEDAAFKIVGSACVSQCTWSVIEDRGFTLQAFLPKLDADVGKISNVGSFLSIDARPVSVARGTPKQIIKIFRDALKQANPRCDGVKEPFIYLEISCPSASYDANVEPAKDDVLFENPDMVVEAARHLFAMVYPAPATGQKQDDVPVPTLSEKQPGYAALDVDDFFTSLEAPPITALNSRASLQTESILPSDFQGSQLRVDNGEDSEVHDKQQSEQRTFRPNMYGCDEEDLDFFGARPSISRTEADFEELRQARNDVTLSNPWVMAKMNKSLRRPDVEPNKTDVSTAHEELSEVVPLLQAKTKPGRPPIELDASYLPTPRPSSPSPPSWGFDPSDHVRDVRPTGDGRLIGLQSLPRPQRQMHSPSSPHEYVHGVSQDQPGRREPPAYDYTVSSQAEQAPAGTPLHAIPDSSSKPRRSQRKPMHQKPTKKPFASPLTGQPPREKVWFDHLESQGRSKRPAAAKRSNYRGGSDGLVHQGELGDLMEDPRRLMPPKRNRDMRDFVTRVDPIANDDAASLIESRNYPRQKRKRSEGATDELQARYDTENSTFTRATGGSEVVSSSELDDMQAAFAAVEKARARPTKRRRTSEARSLREISANATRLNNNDKDFEPSIPNRTASRRRRRTDGTKANRRKSSRLPLERTPAGQQIHNIVSRLSTTVHKVSRSAGLVDKDRSLLGWSEQALPTIHGFPIRPTSAELNDLTAKLYEVLTSRFSGEEMVQDLGALLQHAFAAHERVSMDVDAM